MTLREALEGPFRGKMLVCWSGTLFDQAHPFVRADRVRLNVVGLASGGLRFLSLAGYRPAAVKPKPSLEPEDYQLRFDSAHGLVVIGGATGRRGRHALPADIEPWEEAEPADLAFHELAGPRPLWAQDLDESFGTFSGRAVVSEPPHGLHVPPVVLVSAANAVVKARAGAPPCAVRAVGDRAERDANLVYGQGVLAVRPEHLGHWLALRPAVYRSETPAILAAIDLSSWLD